MDLIIAPYKEILALEENPASHSHAHWVKRPWWKWRLEWGDIGGWRITTADRVEVPCSGNLTPLWNTRYEAERTGLDIKLVSSRGYECDAPVVGSNRKVIHYKAVKVPEPA